MRVECPPPTPPISPTASVVNLVATLGIAPTCPSTCSCPKICELAAPLADIDISTDIGTLQAEPSYLAAAYKICPSTDEVLSQTLNPEAQDFTPKASSSNESTSVPILPASIENKASCSRAPENCCKTSEAAPCNAAKLEKLHLHKKAIQAAVVTCCGPRIPATSCVMTAFGGKKVVKSPPRHNCHGCLQDSQDTIDPTEISPDSGLA